jgi:hypothetical protein
MLNTGHEYHKRTFPNILVDIQHHSQRTVKLRDTKTRIASSVFWCYEVMTIKGKDMLYRTTYSVILRFIVSKSRVCTFRLAFYLTTLSTTKIIQRRWYMNEISRRITGMILTREKTLAPCHSVLHKSHKEQVRIEPRLSRWQSKPCHHQKEGEAGMFSSHKITSTVSAW